MRIGVFVLTLALAGTLAAQQKSRWRRVYTFDDAVVEMEEINLSFGNFGRVRFRTVFDAPRPLRGDTDVKFKTVVEDMEIMCAQRTYRVTEAIFLDGKGAAVHTYKVSGEEGWKEVRTQMMGRLLAPACRMIERKKL